MNVITKSKLPNGCALKPNTLYNATILMPYGITLGNNASLPYTYSENECSYAISGFGENTFFNMDLFLNPVEMLIRYNEQYPSKKILIRNPKESGVRFTAEILQTTNNELIISCCSVNTSPKHGRMCHYKYNDNNELIYVDKNSIDYLKVIRQQKITEKNWKLLDNTEEIVLTAF